MQYFATKRWFSNAQSAEAFSPFQQYIDDLDNKRSRLFPDRKRVPGRKTKYILVIAYLIHVYGFMKLTHAKKLYEIKNEIQKQMQRKVAPYFQSLIDMEYTILKHRTDLIMMEAFNAKGGADYLATFKRFNNPICWVPKTLMAYQIHSLGGTGRYAESMLDAASNRVLSGYNIQNI